MEELSIEEKAKRYDEALKKAKGMHEHGMMSERLEYIFPELNESEDERIKKAIIATIHLYYGEPLENEAKEMIAWLEKQGKKTPQWMIDFLENHRKNFGISMDYDERREVDGKLFSILKWLNGNPQIEQNPAWSEENKFMIQDAIHWIKEFQKSNRCKDENDMQNSVTCEEWLKSLKKRIQQP